MTDFTPTPREEQAEFNNALAFLERLNREEYAIIEEIMRWNLRKAFELIEIYEMELAFTFKKEEQTEIDKMKNEIQKYFVQYPRMGFHVKDARGNWVVINSNMTPIVRDKLLALNKYLRGIKQRTGMLMPKKGEGKLF